jgi:hypothetical protein
MHLNIILKNALVGLYNSRGKDKGNHYRVGGFIYDKKSCLFTYLIALIFSGRFLEFLGPFRARFIFKITSPMNSCTCSCFKWYTLIKMNVNIDITWKIISVRSQLRTYEGIACQRFYTGLTRLPKLPTC